jgi:hypothetical protein
MMGLIVAEEGRVGVEVRSQKPEARRLVSLRLVFFWLLTSVSGRFWLLLQNLLHRY